MKKRTSIKIKHGRQDRIFFAVNYTLLTFLALLVAYPLLYVLGASFSSPSAVTQGRVWLLPVEPSLEGYYAAFRNGRVMTGYLNSILLTVLGTSINLICTIACAYPLSVRDFYGRKFFTGLFTFTMLFSGGLIPTYMVINSLGLYNSYWALILPGAVGVYNMFIARTYFSTSIPYDLYEAASIDGTSDLQYIFRIVLPLSVPIIAVLTLYYAIGHWNAYFSAMIYLQDPEKYPLQVVLRSIIIMNEVTESDLISVDLQLKRQGLANLMKYSLIVISSLPMVMIYPFIQKHFVKGVMLGAVKG